MDYKYAFLSCISSLEENCLVIYQRGGGLKIKVYGTASDIRNFPENYHYTSMLKGKLYAFEILSNTRENTVIVMEAIKWFASYLNCSYLKMLYPSRL